MFFLFDVSDSAGKHNTQTCQYKISVPYHLIRTCLTSMVTFQCVSGSLSWNYFHAAYFLFYMSHFFLIALCRRHHISAKPVWRFWRRDKSLVPARNWTMIAWLFSSYPSYCAVYTVLAQILISLCIKRYLLINEIYDIYVLYILLELISTFVLLQVFIIVLMLLNRQQMSSIVLTKYSFKTVLARVRIKLYLFKENKLQTSICGKYRNVYTVIGYKHNSANR
jgi:hypothetical protein